MHQLLLAIVLVTLLGACDRAPPDAPVATPAAEAPIAANGTANASAPAPAVAPDALVDQAIDDVLGDHARYRVVIDAFQRAVIAKDAAGVSTLVDYPFTAWIGDDKKTIADAKAFVAHYDKIMTPPIAQVIGDQKYRNVFVDEKGVMFGRGEAWINGVCKDGAACKSVDVRVVAIQPTYR